MTVVSRSNKISHTAASQCLREGKSVTSGKLLIMSIARLYHAALTCQSTSPIEDWTNERGCDILAPYMKLSGEKMKMTSMYKDGRAYGVTPVKFSDKADISALKVGETVKISGISKGKGFAGGVKRWNFKGGPATHGQKNRHRAPGSIGNTTPQRVLPGRHMAGHLGMERITYKNIKLVDIDAEKKIVMLGGGVPGPVGRTMEIYLNK